MPVERPTFSESWYRVAGLCPRLRAAVQTHRQHYRGQMWHVVQDPSSNQFFRLNEAGWRFVALLDGRRTVAEAWKIANEQLGDSAPTQGEAIQLLGQLYTSNLLQGDMPPDAEGLLARYRRRRTREIQSTLSNLLFIRLPLFDPDRLLERLVGLFGLLFSPAGFVLWMMIVGAGFYVLAGHWPQLLAEAEATTILSPERLPLLYLSYVLIKVVHEFGHALACKKFGKASGSGGEVHVLGLMFLVFTPLPYVDASSSWALRSKWHRMVVGAAGMMVELAVAAAAAVVWTRTPETSAAHTVAYNIMFIGSVSTILFNANPLLRYDGYYMLSDLLEIPNLAQRSRDYLYYLIKRYVWGVKQPRNPAHTPGERAWLFVYSLASTVYRVFISVAILLFVADALPFLGALLAAAAAVAWLVVPLGRFLYYLASSSELARCRGRAIVTSVIVPGLALAALARIPAPDRFYVDGVVEPVGIMIVSAAADGFLEEGLASGRPVTAGETILAKSSNPVMVAEREQYRADRRQLLARRGLTLVEEPAGVAAIDRQIAAVDEKIRRVESQLADLVVRAPIAGTWFSPDIDRLHGAYVRRGQPLGTVATIDDLRIRAVAGQGDAGPLMDAANTRIDIRVADRPDLEVGGTLVRFLPSGQARLPAPSLGADLGGPVPVTREPQGGVRPAERLFEIHVAPDRSSDVRLLAGQRVVLRLQTAPKPYLVQAWRSVLQLLQRRFHV